MVVFKRTTKNIFFPEEIFRQIKCLIQMSLQMSLQNAITNAITNVIIIKSQKTYTFMLFQSFYI